MLSRMSAVASLFVAVLGVAGMVQGGVIISDTFTGTNGTLVTAHTPDTNLPGGSWAQPDYDWGYNSISGNTMLMNTSGSERISVASSGSYTKPTALSISADLKLGTVDDGTYVARGLGLGFWQTNTSTSYSAFRGLFLTPIGSVTDADGIENNGGQGYATVAWSGVGGAAFDPNSFYTLSYDVDTATGRVTRVSLSGSNADFSSIVAVANNIFTYAQTTYAGLIVSANNGGKVGYADNFVVSTVPEPATIGLIGLGSVGVLSRRRRMA